MTTPTELAGRKARTHEANRLTADDRTAVRRRLAEHVAACPPGPLAHYVTTAQELHRVACAAIGCTAHDLRHSELEELYDLVAELLADHYFPATIHAEPATGYGTD